MSKKIHTIQSSGKEEFDKKVNSFLELGFELLEGSYEIIKKDDDVVFYQVVTIETDKYDVEFYENGQIRHICPLNINGFKDGEYHQWDENGKEILYINYVDGVEHFERKTNEKVCVETRYYNNGLEKDRNSYRYGELHGCCTEWYDNGQKKIERHYLDGMDHGYWTEWYENGQKSVERIHENGISIEVWTWWRENGEKDEEMFFKNGKLTLTKIFMEDGYMKERISGIRNVYFKHFKDNSPFKEEIYEMGTLVSVKELNEDGTVKEVKEY